MHNSLNDRELDQTTSMEPPKGLLSRIMQRLGLEQELILIKRYLGFFSALLVIFLILSVFAFIGLRQVLSESSFGPFISLAFSDPSIAIKYWHSFFLAVFESFPGVTFVALLASTALLLLFVRLTAFSTQKLLTTVKSIKKYGHK